MLPPYSALRSNCECVAVWCKTGTWATLQASSWLAVAVAGQAKSAVMLAGTVLAAQVTVPAAGVWGSWLGYTTHASLAVTQPYLLPAIAAYGIMTAGAPAMWLARNAAFWEHAVQNPDEFGACLIEWSAQYELPVGTAVRSLDCENDDDNDDDDDDDAALEESTPTMTQVVDPNKTVPTTERNSTKGELPSPLVVSNEMSEAPEKSLPLDSSPQAAGQPSQECDRTTTREKQENKIASVLMV